MEYLSGVVERITYFNEESGYTVIKLKSKGYYDLITVVGNMASVHVGAILSLRGQWKVDSRYGKQFLARVYEEKLPASVVGIEKYLGSGLIKGIGPVNAKRIVKAFGKDTIDIIEEQPHRLTEVPGIGPKRIEMIKKAWQEQKEVKNIMLFLQSYGVSTSHGAKIYKTYGNESLEIVKENPYRLADDIWGIGFRTADNIAQKLGFDSNSTMRCRSGILYILNQLSNEGHCFATHQQLIEETIKVLSLDKDKIEESIYMMVEDGSIIEDQEALYLPPFYHSELGVAKRIKEIISIPSLWDIRQVDRIIDKIEKENNLNYDETQREAIKKAVSSKFMVLTGGPGTGKTFTIQGIIQAFEGMGAKIYLAAPTGRAAKRMTETTGREAKTIHRLLEYKPPQGYMRNIENNPLECDVLIIDETSMVDIILMYNLLKAVRDKTTVILVGDVDQLPSVGAGNVLSDIIGSDQVEVVKLTKIFRQAQHSAIITNAHRINQGVFPVLKSRKNRDFFFIKRDDPEEIVSQIRELCTSRLPNYYRVDPIDDIQVLCPMQRGVTGAANMNRVLQEALNRETHFIKYGGTVYKVGDKVMQIRNNYDKNTFNGDIGRIISINLEDKTVDIDFDGSLVEYDSSELDEIMLAYATTVHKSQGSEYKIVVAPFTTQHYMMLQRNLLYTCITRARNIFVMVGTERAVGIAVGNNKIVKRNTMLDKRLANPSS
ncbi:MAG: ATP-dependent RecD-like DNA helicase [Clostridiales bacterium]|nr:ATP-dependent RecD-like DNA helicase [Clostridiales bacterium]